VYPSPPRPTKCGINLRVSRPPLFLFPVGVPPAVPTLRVVIDLPGLSVANFTEAALLNVTLILANAANLTVNDTRIVSVDDVLATNGTSSNATLARLLVAVRRGGGGKQTQNKAKHM
jgi:hypothetical protein